MSRVFLKDPARVDRPPVVGSLGLVYVPEERRLDNNLTTAVEKVLTAAIQENMKPPDPKLDKMARRLGKLYESGTDSVRVASSVVNILDETQFKSEKSELFDKKRHLEQMRRKIEDDGMYSIPATHGYSSPVKAPMRSADAVRLMETRPGGKHYVPPERKKETIYEPRIFSAPNHASIVNRNSPRMWPEHTMYTPSMTRTGSESVLPTIPAPKKSLIPVGDEQFPLSPARKKPLGTSASASANLKNFGRSGSSVYGCSTTTTNASQQKRFQNGADADIPGSFSLGDGESLGGSSSFGSAGGSSSIKSIASLYSKTGSPKKTTKVDAKATTSFPKNTGRSRRRKQSPDKSKGSPTRATNNQSHQGHHSDGWYASMATNVSTGSNVKDVSLSSKSMSSLQQVLLRDGFSKAEVCVSANHPEAGSVATRGVGAGAGAGAGAGGGSLTADSMSNISIHSGFGDDTNQNKGYYNTGEEGDDAFELIPLPELYENCRIKDANRQHKKAVAKHSEWLMKGNFTKKKPKKSTLKGDSVLNSPVGSSPTDSPGSRVGGSPEPGHGSWNDHGRDVVSSAFLDLEMEHLSDIIPKLADVDPHGPSELEKWRQKVRDEEEEKQLLQDVANKNTVANLIGRKAGDKRSRTLKPHESSSYTDQLTDYLQLTTAHSGVKTWNQEQKELNSASYNSTNGSGSAAATSTTTCGSKGSSGITGVATSAATGGGSSLGISNYSGTTNHSFNSSSTNGNGNVGKAKKISITNPYRAGIQGTNKGMPAAINMRPAGGAQDNIAYSKSVYIDNHFTSNFTLVSSELLDRNPKQLMDRRRVQKSATVLINPVEHTVAPTKKSVTTALNSIARKGILAYDTRIVEIGATIRACVDIRHPVPGIAAVMSLHRSFIDMASTNPNPVTVTRSQVFQVVHSALDWLSQDSIQRLISAYDPQHTGVIRYARITTALVACCRANMAALSGKRPDDVDASVPADCIADLLLLRLMHQMYDESEGGGARTEEHERATGDVSVTGMKIDDIVEMLSCCAASVQDEIEIENASEDMMTLLYIDIQNDKNNGTTPIIRRELTDENKRIARVSIKHSMLKQLKGIAKVSKEQFIKCLTNTPKLLTLFSTQAKRFRELVYPYMHGGSVPFADENGKKAENYGSQRTRMD